VSKKVYKQTPEEAKISRARDEFRRVSQGYHTLISGEPIYEEGTGKLLEVRRPQPGKARRLLRKEHKRIFGHSGFGMHISWITYRVLCVLEISGLEKEGLHEKITEKMRHCITTLRDCTTRLKHY